MGRRNHSGMYHTPLPTLVLYLTPHNFPRMQSFITFMDALKLRLRAKDQLHPILQELVTGYARFKGSKDWEGRSRMVSW